MTIDRTPELEQTILDHLISGLSMHQLSKKPGMPDRVTIHRWMAKDTEFATKCARARLAQAHGYLDYMQDITERVEAGTLAPDAARVVLSNLQWRIPKLAPKKYGDKIALTGGDEDDLPINHSVKVEFVGPKAVEDDNS